MFNDLRSSRSRATFVLIFALFAVITFVFGVYLDSLGSGQLVWDVVDGGIAQLLLGIAGAILGAGLVIFVLRFFRPSERRMTQDA